MSISSGVTPAWANAAGGALRAGAGGDVAAVLAVLGGLAAADDPDRLLLDVAGDIGGDEDGRAAAVGDHAALEQVQRVGDDPRLKHVLDGDLVTLTNCRSVIALTASGLRIACLRVATEICASCSVVVP